MQGRFLDSSRLGEGFNSSLSLIFMLKSQIRSHQVTRFVCFDLMMKNENITDILSRPKSLTGSYWFHLFQVSMTKCDQLFLTCCVTLVSDLSCGWAIWAKGYTSVHDLYLNIV